MTEISPIKIKIAGEIRENALEKKSIMDRFEIGLKNISEKKRINGGGSNGNSHAGFQSDFLARKPLVIPPPSLPSVFEALSSIPTAAIIKVRPRHIRIVQLYMTGNYKRSEIAEIVGVTQPTITNVLKTPAAIDIMLNNYDNIKEDFNQLSNLAVSALRQGLTSQDEERKVKAAVDYFKLINSQVKKKLEITGKDGGPIQVEDIKRRMFAKLDLDPTILIDMEENGGDSNGA